MTLTPDSIAPAGADPAIAAGLAGLSIAELLAAADPATLTAALAAANDRVALDAATAAASDRVTAALAAAVQNVADIAAAAGLAGLTAPDPTALVAAAITRATPVAPEVLTALVDPAPPVAPAPSGRRTRRRVERVWTAVPRGSIWECSLAGESGRVRINPRGDGSGATFTALTGSCLSTDSPSRAVQSATGDPAGAGRRGEATVNGWVALTRDGRTLADWTVPPV